MSRAEIESISPSLTFSLQNGEKINEQDLAAAEISSHRLRKFYAIYRARNNNKIGKEWRVGLMPAGLDSSIPNLCMATNGKYLKQETVFL